MKKLFIILGLMFSSVLAMGTQSRPKTVPLKPQTRKEKLEFAKAFLTSSGKTKDQLRRAQAGKAS